MLSRRVRRLAVPALGVALVATLSVGVTFASTSTSGAKACVTGRGYLALRSAKGACPAHTKAVTLGRSGPAGKRGATGPSNGYVGAHTSHGVTISDTSKVVTLHLPAGSYLLSAQVTVENYAMSSAQVGCNFDDGKFSDPQADLTVIPAVMAGDDTLPNSGSLSLDTALALKSAATLTVECGGGATGDVTATGTVTALRVAALAASGDPTFGLQDIHPLSRS